MEKCARSYSTCGKISYHLFFCGHFLEVNDDDVDWDKHYDLDKAQAFLKKHELAEKDKTFETMVPLLKLAYIVWPVIIILQIFAGIDTVRGCRVLKKKIYIYTMN